MKLNKKDTSVTIDIIGKEIGASWFSDGFTADDLNREIKEATDITINLSS